MRYFSPANQKVSPSTTQSRPPPLWQRPKRAESGSVDAARADRSANVAGSDGASCKAASVPTNPPPATRISRGMKPRRAGRLRRRRKARRARAGKKRRSEEHTSELQSLMRIPYAVFCLKKKNNSQKKHKHNRQGTTLNNRY